MPHKLRLAVSQSHTRATTALTLAALESTLQRAASDSVDLVLFPEAYLGGYPRSATFGGTIGTRTPADRETFLHYFKDAVDLGDTPQGAGHRWVKRELEIPKSGVRGDGTREELEKMAKETGVFIVTGVVEKCAGTLYCGALYVCPRMGVIGKRRKVMPTAGERLVWGQGQPSSLRAVTTTIRGVRLTLAAAICWENYMPLLRYSLYSQNVNLYLAPTADARESWLPLMRTIASEGRCFVLTANQCMRKSNLPSWITRSVKEAEYAVSSLGESPGMDGIRENAPTNVWADAGAKDKPQKQLRRKSTTTTDGHEIIFSTSKNEDGHQQQQARGDAWTKSTITSTGHKMVFPDEEERGVGEDLPPKLRRKSTTTIDGHEIALPDVTQETPRRGKLSESKVEPSELVSRGGSCIIGPLGEVLAGPLWDVEDGLLAVDVDFEDVVRGKLDLDVCGSYSRNDSFKLMVEGLDLSPPL